MARPEQDIQRAVFAHLKLRAAPGVFAFHPFNGGKRSPVEAAIMKGAGARAGLPDVLLIKAGQTYCLELKSLHGRLSPAQRQTLHELQSAGAVTGVAYTLGAALAWLEGHGLLKGTAQ